MVTWSTLVVINIRFKFDNTRVYGEIRDFIKILTQDFLGAFMIED
jgi:hypothetical protein